MTYEYKAVGIVHAKMINPWPVNKVGIFENVTEQLNDWAEEGWELITAIPAGNNDRAIYILRKKK